MTVSDFKKNLLFVAELIGSTFYFALADNFINTFAEKCFCVDIVKFTFLRNVEHEAFDVQPNAHDG